MRAILKDHLIAESDDIVESGGYHYFPSSTVPMEWLERAEKTESDRACPHGWPGSVWPWLQMENRMRSLATVAMSCVLAAGVTAIALNAAISGERIILAAEDPPQGTPPTTDAAKPGSEHGSDQGPPKSAAPDADDSTKTDVGKPGMGCCTMMPNGGIMCKC
jgi:hypothetical protein